MKKQHHELISFVTKLLEKDQLICLIHYGSSRSKKEDYNDIDLMAVCKKVEGIEVFHLGCIDLLKISPEEQEHFVSLLDPVYGTEPLLTGKPIWGDHSYFHKLANRIRNVTPSENALDYLLKQSLALYNDAWQSLNRGLPRLSLDSLAYSTSYFLFASHYSTNSRVTTFTKLLKLTSNRFIEMLFKQHSLSKKTKSVQVDDVRKYLQMWRKELVSGTLGFHEKVI